MSPGRPRSPERLNTENIKLKADLALASETFDREMATKLREEAERTVSKVEELWRVTQENEQLKAELAACQLERQREQAEVQVLRHALAAVDVVNDSREGALWEARSQLAAARAEADKLECALASLNRHATGLCTACGSLYRHQHTKLETASYRSRSPRFGKGNDHARCGTKAGGNAALSAEKTLPGPGAHHPLRDKHGDFTA